MNNLRLMHEMGGFTKPGRHSKYYCLFASQFCFLLIILTSHEENWYRGDEVSAPLSARSVSVVREIPVFQGCVLQHQHRHDHNAMY